MTKITSSTTKRLLTVGDRVRLIDNKGYYTFIKKDTFGEVVGFNNRYPKRMISVQFEEHVTMEMYDSRFELATPKEPTAPMTKAVLELLRAKGALTSMEAQGVLRCRQLPARILELKRLGHAIVTELKSDKTEQRYARYHLEMWVA